MAIFFLRPTADRELVDLDHSQGVTIEAVHPGSRLNGRFGNFRSVVSGQTLEAIGT
jgi:hypothetical protein